MKRGDMKVEDIVLLNEITEDGEAALGGVRLARSDGFQFLKRVIDDMQFNRWV